MAEGGLTRPRLQIAESPAREYLLKVLVIGDSGVGKTALVRRFFGDGFEESAQPTIGVDFRLRSFDVDGRCVKMQIWDTAGQERFRSVTNAYYRGAHATVLVYDVTSPATLAHTRIWHDEVAIYSNEAAVWFLIGNKCDRPRAAPLEDAVVYAKEIGATHLETSARMATNVDDMFDMVARETVARAHNRPLHVPMSKGVAMGYR